MKLPGPKAKKILERDRKFISPSYPRTYPAVIEKGSGMYVWDVDGNRFIDFCAGIAVNATGYCHPEVVNAIKEQAERLIHISGTDFYYKEQVDLAEKLAIIVPGGPNRRAFLTNSGAEAIEAAMKLARWATKRTYFISFYHSFHGRTYGAMSLSASKSLHHAGFAPLLPGIVHVPFPYCYRCPWGMTHPDCDFVCVKYIEDVVFAHDVPPEEVAAMFVEPIIGEGGYIPAPVGYFQRLKQLLDKYEILFAVDEIQTGMGRTGKMFAIEHWDVIPDIVAIAKGIASGLPLGAMVARRSLMEWPPGAHANTFGGNPIACRVALVTIKLLEEGLIDNAAKMGKYMLDKLREMQNEFDFIGDVRGIGLMIGVEIVRDRKTKEKDINLRNRIVYRAFEEGLLILGAGENVIRFSPPLVITQKEADEGLDIFYSVLKEVSKGR